MDSQNVSRGVNGSAIEMQGVEASFGAEGIPGARNGKMHKAQAKVSQTKDLMQMNVQKMINNQNELGDIETRAGDLKNIAFNVKNNADQLRKEAARRNTRVMILTAIIGVAILAYIILPLVSVDNKHEKEA